MLFKRSEPHVFNVAPDDTLDLTSIIGISILILTSILLLIFICVIRCRCLRRRNCSLCGLRVPATGLERVEGFWQRIWHEACWDKRMGLGGMEKGGGKGAMSPASLRSPKAEKGIESPRLGSSRVSSPLASPGWKPVPPVSTTQHPLAMSNIDTLPSTYVPAPPTLGLSAAPPSTVIAHSTPSIDMPAPRARPPPATSYLHSDPYAKQQPTAFPFPPMSGAPAPLQPPPCVTSRYIHPSHPYPMVQTPPSLLVPVIQEQNHPASTVHQSAAPTASHMIGRETEMGGSRQPLLSALPPRNSSRAVGTGVAF